MREDAEEGAKQDAPNVEPKKRKAQKPPTPQHKSKKKVDKLTQAKPTTRVDTRETTKVEKEQENKKAT